MCGIVGIFAYGSRQPVDPSELLRIRDHMLTRGPDGAGMWLSEDQRIGFGHRRLEIIGLGEQGAQPMVLDYCQRSVPDRLVITFNGEIYNHRELRCQLESKGHVFKSSCDTEVLLHLYEEYQDGLVDHLRGMYAFGIWDAGGLRLLLARDPFGIKPLYYADHGGTLRFASQVRALLSGGAIPSTVDEGGLAGFFVLGSVPEPRTAWASIRSVPAGSTMTIGPHGHRSVRAFFSVADELRNASAASDGDLSRAIGDSVRAHLVADVEVGAFLSAGIDSGAILALAAEEQGAVSAITLGFQEFHGSHHDEALVAAVTARAYGAKHDVEEISLTDAEASLRSFFASMDQPSIDGLNTWFVSRAAHRSGLKVALSGVGGDELLGGYSTFVSVPQLRRRLRAAACVPGLGRASRAVLRAALPTTTHPKIASLLEYSRSLEMAWLLRRSVFLPWELGSLLGNERAIAALEALRLEESVLHSVTNPDPGNDVGRVAALETGLYMRNQLLRDADWASMAHSLEIRVPLVDVPLYRFAACRFQTWSPTAPKSPLALAPASSLPSEVLGRAKTGFSLPMNRIVARAMSAEACHTIPKPCSSGGWSRPWAYIVASELQLIP